MSVSDSRFYMWRTIFAMAHADHQVTENEQSFMRDALKGEKFSKKQRQILEEDIKSPQNAADMFLKIDEQEDRSRFFYYARMLCWCDGQFDEQEQEIIIRLRQLHAKNIDFDRLLKSLDMVLEEEQKEMLVEDMRKEDHLLKKFLRRFRS